MNIFALLNSTKLDMRILCFKESRQIQIQDLTFPASFPTLHMTGHHELTALGVFLLSSSFYSVSGISETHPRTPYKQTLTVWWCMSWIVFNHTGAEWGLDAFCRVQSSPIAAHTWQSRILPTPSPLIQSKDVCSHRADLPRHRTCLNLTWWCILLCPKRARQW